MQNRIDSTYIQRQLKTKQCKIAFPSGFVFSLKIPEQTHVHELTQIIRNYNILHSMYGPKMEGIGFQPNYLSSVNGDVITNLYMIDQDGTDKEIGVLNQLDFKIQYARIAKCRQRSTGALKYQFLGKIKHNSHDFLYIIRNQQTSKLYALRKVNKQNMVFKDIEKLFQAKDYLLKYQKDHQSYFLFIYQLFETQKSLCIVSQLLPFRLSKIKIDSKYLMDIILAQMTKLIHILDRDNITINKRKSFSLNSQLRDNQISYTLEDFSMNFKLQIKYDGVDLNFQQKLIIKPSHIHIQQQDNQNGNKILSKFNQNMTKIFEELLKNCNMKIIQLYIPLLHWFKNKRITTYTDFLKYTQINLINYVSQTEDINLKRKLALKNIMKSYSTQQMMNLTQDQTHQFSQKYQPKTNIFYWNQQTSKKQAHVKFQPENGSKTNRIMKDMIENISTVKKKKQSILLMKPLVEARNWFKCKKLQRKSKNKSKSFIQSKNNNTKKHVRKISQFLIDD